MHFPVITPSLSSLFQRIDHGASAMFAFLGCRHHENGDSDHPITPPIITMASGAAANTLASSPSRPHEYVLQHDSSTRLQHDSYNDDGSTITPSDVLSPAFTMVQPDRPRPSDVFEDGFVPVISFRHYNRLQVAQPGTDHPFVLASHPPANDITASPTNWFGALQRAE